MNSFSPDYSPISYLLTPWHQQFQRGWLPASEVETSSAVHGRFVWNAKLGPIEHFRVH